MSIIFLNCPVCLSEYSLTGPDLAGREKQCECPVDLEAEARAIEAERPKESDYMAQYQAGNGGLFE